MIKLKLTPSEKEVIKRMSNYKLKAFHHENNLKYYIVKDKKLCEEFGWLPHEIIEEPKSAYPINKRWDILNKSLSKDKKIISISKFEYKHKKTARSKLFFSENVYKLKHSRIAEYAVYLSFEDDLKSYLDSDYFNDDKCIIKILYNNVSSRIDLCQKNSKKPIFILPPSFIIDFLNCKIDKDEEILNIDNIFDYLILYCKYDYIHYKDNSLIQSLRLFEQVQIQFKELTKNIRSNNNLNLFNKIQEIESIYDGLYGID